MDERTQQESRKIRNRKRGCVISHIQYALKGQKLLAQGIALGNHGRKFVALKGQKLSSTRQFTKLLPLQGALLTAIIPRAMPWAKSFWAFSPFLNHMLKLNYLE